MTIIGESSGVLVSIIRDTGNAWKLTGSDYRSGARAALLAKMGGTRNMLGLPLVSESIADQSNEVSISQRGQVTNAKSVGGGSSGDISTYLEFFGDTGGPRLLMEGAMGNELVDYAGSYVGDVTVSSMDMTITGTGYTPIPILNSYLSVTGTDPENTGVFKVVAASATAITFRSISGTAPVPGTGLTLTTAGSVVGNGNTVYSHVIEKDAQDVGITAVFPDVSVVGMDMSLSLNDYIGLSFPLIGGKSVEPGVSTINTGTPVNADIGAAPYEASNNIQAIVDDGAVANWFLKSASISVSLDGAEARGALGTPSSIGVRRGVFNASVSTEGYFSDSVAMNRFYNQNLFSLAFLFQDDLGNQVIISLPSVRVTEAAWTLGDPNQDVSHPVKLMAQKDSVSGYTMIVTTIPA